MNRADEYKLLATLFRTPDADEGLQREHVRLFTPTVAGGIPPYEMEYGKLDIFLKSQMMADVAGFYHAFGLDVADEAHERVDFIGTELEFLSWLLLKEERAGAKKDRGNAQLCRDAQAKFLKDHLGRWAPFFGLQVTRNARLPFYRTLGRRLTRFIASECRRLKVTPEPVSGWTLDAEAAEEMTCGPGEAASPPQPLTVL